MKKEVFKGAIPKARNPVAAQALFKKAGSHVKSHKALRKAENQKAIKEEIK